MKTTTAAIVMLALLAGLAVRIVRRGQAMGRSLAMATTIDE